MDSAPRVNTTVASRSGGSPPPSPPASPPPHRLRRPTTSPPPVIADGHYDVNGALGGALIGYNIAFSQFANFGLFNQLIIGAEGDIAGSTLSGHSAACSSGTGLHTCGGNVYALSDVRARLGLPLGQFMTFIAGGLAVDDIRTYDSLFGTSGTHWEAGRTAGAGIDYKITDQISVRLDICIRILRARRSLTSCPAFLSAFART
jgi:opacity protein-like surface antigen